MNKRAVDPWTIVHAAIGAASGALGAPLAAVVVTAAAYEILEQRMEQDPRWQRRFGTAGPESGANVAVDLLVMVVGHYVGNKLR